MLYKIIPNFIFYIILCPTYALKINRINNPIQNSIYNSIGKWSLLYTSNICVNDDLILDIKLSRLVENELDIKLSLICKNHFINTKKIISFVTKELDNTDDTDYTDNTRNKNIKCNLIFLTSERFIQSFGIIDFPEVIKKYDSSYQSENVLSSDIYIDNNKLYIHFNNHDYIFDRILNIPNEKENIISKTFILSNLLSFFFGKIFENMINN